MAHTGVKGSTKNSLIFQGFNRRLPRTLLGFKQVSHKVVHNVRYGQLRSLLEIKVQTRTQ